MEIAVSVVFLLVAVGLCLKSSLISPRIYYLFAIFGWCIFLLTFRLNFLIRSVLGESRVFEHSSPFVSGVLAYDEALLDIKISLGLLFLSLALLVFFPTRKHIKDKNPLS